MVHTQFLEQITSAHVHKITNKLFYTIQSMQMNEIVGRDTKVIPFVLQYAHTRFWGTYIYIEDYSHPY